MKNIAVGFIILILVVIGLFVVLPYALNFVNRGKGINVFPRFFSLPAPGIYQPGSVNPNVGQTPALEKNASVYKGRVRISSISGGARQTVLISGSYAASSINVSGWRVVNSKGFETLITNAVNLVGLDTSSPIYLSSAYIALISGASPITDNFRLNKCLGWLNNVYNFNPSVSSFCPAFSLGDFTGLDGPCKDLLLRTPSCAQPNAGVLNNYSSACRDFVDRNYSYSACVTRHRQDQDFFSDWRVYTGSNVPIFDPLHDVLELRDQGGLLVDTYQY